VFTSGMVMLVAFYFVAIFFTIVSGQSATKAGVQLIFFAPGMGAGVFISIRMIKFFRQPKYPIILGTLIIPVAIGLISMGIKSNQNAQINGFMVMAGVGTGMTFAPTGIHARFSQPANRVAVVESLQLFFRVLGGTVGVAQCATVLNAKVKASIKELVLSGLVPPSTSFSNSVGSLGNINSLPGPVAIAIKDAFRNGTRWAFISLIPWTGIAVFMTVFLSKIEDTDAQAKLQKQQATATLMPESSTTKPAAEANANNYKTSPNGAVSNTSARNAISDVEAEAELGPAPTTKGVFGPIGYIVYLVRKKNWESRRRKLEEQRSTDRVEGSGQV